MKVWILVVALLMPACAREPEATVTPVAEAATLEQLYLQERYGELVRLATHVIEDEDTSRAREAEARFFRALAWLAEDPQDPHDRALLELRTLEFEFPELIWGRIAALHVASATRLQALQATLLSLAAEQSELQVRIDVLEQSLIDVQSQLDERELQLAELGRERSELLEQLEQARAEMDATAARLRELENELEALKLIDMQREP
jgi:chromosome segregation ATPase